MKIAGFIVFILTTVTVLAITYVNFGGLRNEKENEK